MKLTTTDDVFDCLSAYVASAALGTAIELGLFWLLAEQPLDAPGVAQALNIPIKRCQYWLQLLHSVGLIEQVSAGYAPSSVARIAILDTFSQESWAYLAQEERERFPSFCDLALHIREPGSIRTAQGLATLNYVEKMANDPERAHRFTRMLYELHQPMANRLTELLDMTSVHRLMDLGGGSGVVSLALLRRHPHLTSTVVDIENVCIAGREIAVENSLADRITYHAADFVHDELPGGYDMVLHCDVGVYSEALFHKFWAVLNQGGRLVIVDHFAPAENIVSPARLYWTFQDSLADPDLEVMTAAKLQNQLMQAGFRLLSESTVLPGGWLMIQAHK
jgi:ubiquinone/menaquinone biosynthesis C-methylase UbiE